MPKIRPGKGQLNILNVSVGVIQDFDENRKGIGPEGMDIPRWAFFEKVWREWKATKTTAQSHGKAVAHHVTLKPGQSRRGDAGGGERMAG